jgi:hypothetical protein
VPGAGAGGGKDGPNRALAETNNYFAPRLGIAWDVTATAHGVRAGVGRFIERESLQNGLNLGFNPPFNRASWAAGRSTATPSRSTARSRRTRHPQFGLDTSGKFGYTWQWNVSVQKEVATTPRSRSATWAPRAAAALALRREPGSGRRSRRQRRLRPAGLHPRRQRQRRQGRAAPYGVFGNENISILAHGGSSIYHSLQTQLVSRFGQGSQFQASYTFSRTLGDVSLAGGENGVGSTPSACSRT